MKLVFAVLLGISLFNTAMAAPAILNWQSTELSEADAARAVSSGVRSFIEEENFCEMEEVWDLEAVNHLKDMHGNPVILVLSTAQADGVRCNLDKYLDCETRFYREKGAWKYDYTTCEKEARR